MDADDENQATEADAQGVTLEETTTVAEEGGETNAPEQTEEPIIELTEDDQVTKEEEVEADQPIIETATDEQVVEDDVVAIEPTADEITAGESLPDEVAAAEEPVTEEAVDKDPAVEESTADETAGDVPAADEVTTELEEPNQEENALTEPGEDVHVPEESAAEEIVDGEPAQEVVEEPVPEEPSTEEAVAAETPVGEEPPADETAVEESAAEEAAPEEAPTEEAPTEEALTEEAPTEEVPTEEAPTEEAPTEEAPTEEAPTEEAPTDEAPTEEPPTDEAAEERDVAIEDEAAAVADGLTDEQPPAEEDTEVTEQGDVKIEAAEGDEVVDEETEGAEIKDADVTEGGEEPSIGAVDEDAERQPAQDEAEKEQPEMKEEIKEDVTEKDEGSDQPTKKDQKPKTTIFAPEDAFVLDEVSHRESDRSSGGSQGKGPTAPSKKYKKTYPYRAASLDETKIQQDIKVPAPQHEYFGMIFSAESKRPPSYYHNYFLPFQKQPGPHQHIKVVGKHIPAQVGKDNLTSTNALPLSTLKLRWMLNRRHTVYKASDLYAYLSSRFGAIENIYQVSSNSAIVVFAELASAYAAVKAQGLGYPWDPLIADWWEPRMNNHAYLRKYLSIEDTSIYDLKIYDSVPPPPRY